MIQKISHRFEDESIESKARWFQSLSLAERMEVFCSYTNLILSVNPKILETKRARPIEGRVRVISKA